MATSFHQYSPRAQALICVAVSVFGLAAAWQVLIAPERAQLAVRRDRLAIVTADVARATQTAQRLPIIQREVAALEAALLKTTAVLPDEKDAQDVLRDLHILASEAAIRLSTFTPKPVAAKAQYTEWPIEIGLEGGYHDLGRFFDRVANEPRLISVSNLHLKAGTSPPGSARAGRAVITATCVATTFVFSPPAAGVQK